MCGLLPNKSIYGSITSIMKNTKIEIKYDLLEKIKGEKHELDSLACAVNKVLFDALSGKSNPVTERPVEVEDAAEDSHRVLELIIEAKDQGEAYDGIQGLLEGGLLLTSDGYDRAVKLQRRFGNIAGGKW